MAISVLDKETVKLVTATQVITSISSVAKELIENAFDANATNIEINLTDNGCSLIEVKDDGCGISRDNARYMALSSHTSKIVNFSDLDSLETYGFRGEALFSLCAVSDVTIISKTDQDESAVSYKIDHCGCIEKSESCHRAAGTTVQVRQLFRQMPVRRQIITNPKKVSQDIKTLELLIKSYAMCKFLSRISYRLDNNVVFVKPSMDTLEDAVTYILGRKVTSNMEWIDIANPKIKMMIPCKRIQNASEIFQHGAQYIFVNNRPIKHKELEKMLTRIIVEGLQQEMLKKRPIFIVYILINSADIDVNLEPNKTTVLFKQKHIVMNAIEECLENFYDIHREQKQQNDDCNHSFSAYQDYSQSIITDKDEQPACKKRKLGTKVDVVEFNDKNVKSGEPVAHTDERPTEFAEIERELKVQRPPILSDSDSNDSEGFKLTYNDNDVSRTSVEGAANEDIKDSQPFELTPDSERLSQLPFVDLGEDFDVADISSSDRGQKESQKQDIHLGSSRENQSLKNTCIELEWSKGHVPGIKGSTDVQVHNYAPPKEVPEDSECRNKCAGFRIYSDEVIAQVREKNPSFTAPEIARAIIKLWKKLSPQERGYYRDIASDENSEYDSERRHEIDLKKNKSRLATVLKKIKTVNLKNQSNLVMRSTKHWDIDLKKVKDSFLSNLPCESNNFVVGLLRQNLWIIKKSAHIWIMDDRNLNKEVNVSHAATNKADADNIEKSLQQWFTAGNDLSLLHPIYSLTVNKFNDS